MPISSETDSRSALKLSTLRWSAGLGVGFILLATLLTWWNVRLSNQRHLAEDMQADAATAASVAEVIFNERVHAIDRMGLEWEALGGIPPEAWDANARITAENLSGIQGIALADPDGRILRIMPRKGNERALGFILSSEPQRRAALEQARISGKVALSGRIALTQGGEGLLIVRSIRDGDRHTGYISAAFRFLEVMQQLNADLTEKGQALTLLHQGKPVYTAPALSPKPESHNDIPLRIADGQWQLRLRTSAEALAARQSSAPDLVMFAGLGCALLLSAMFLFWLRSARQQVIAGEMQMRWQFAIEGSGLGLWDWDASTNKVYFSMRWKEMLGYADEDIGDSLDEWKKRTHPDDAAAIDLALAEHFSGRTPMYECEHRMLCKDGTYKWILDRGKVMLWDERGKPLRMLGTHSDISKRKNTELALEEQKNMLQQVLDSQSVATFMLDTEHRVIHWNRACEQLTGIAASEILGKAEAWRGFYPDQRPVLADLVLDAQLEALGQYYAEQSPSILIRSGWHAENWVTGIHGYRRFAIFDAAPIYDSMGNIVSVIETLQDITEQKTAALALSENARFIEAILDNAADTIVTINQNGIIQSVNKAVRSTFGYHPEELVGQNINRLMPPAQGEDHNQRLQSYLQSGQPQVIGTRRELEAMRKDGSLFPISLGVSELNYEDKRLFIGLIHDISESKRIEQELQAGKETAQYALAALEMQRFALDQHSIVAITDLRGRITYANQKFCDISGYTREELIGQDHRMLNSGVHPKAFFSDLYRTVSGGQVWHAEICNRNKDGNLYWVDTTLVPFIGPEGKPQQYIAIRTDITLRKQNEQELARHRDHLEELVAEQTSRLILAKEAAEQANHAKSEFLANMSHELRTPLHAILSFSEIGEDKAGSATAEKIASYFNRIRNSGERLLVLLNDLLDLAKLEAGKMHIEPGSHDLLGALLEALAEMESLIANKHIALQMHPVECDTVCDIDPLRIGQVLRNLLSNAIKFTPENGKLEIRLHSGHLPRGRRTQDDSQQPAIVLEVIDSGVGIPHDELDTIFDKFIQSSKTKSGAGGTGLGLAICREIVAAHHGTIAARNNPEAGATFTLTLPYSAGKKEIA